jgi:hypothetical protein
LNKNFENEISKLNTSFESVRQENEDNKNTGAGGLDFFEKLDSNQLKITLTNEERYR